MKKFLLILPLCAFAAAAFAQTTLVDKDTGHGRQIGTKPTQGLAFFGGVPVVQQSGTNELILTLYRFGLIDSATSATPLNLHGGTFTDGTIMITGSNIAIGTNGTATALMRSGTGTLTTGTCIVSDTNVRSTAVFSFAGVGTTAAGTLCVGTINSGTNFAIVSTSGSDGRAVHWRYTQ